MAWSVPEGAGSAVVLEKNVAVTATNLAAHVASATVIGSSSCGQITMTADGTGGSTGVQFRFPFPDLVANGRYVVTVTQDSSNSAAVGTQLTSVPTGGVFTNAGVASLYVSILVTGAPANSVTVYNYVCIRVA